jgi:flagellar capping protein FliD
MAISATNVSNLDSYYQQLLESQIAQEKRPLDTIQFQLDDLKIQKAMYDDLSGKFDGFQDTIKALLSTDAFYNMTPGRTASVNTTADQTVLLATASASAIVGSYTIDIAQLARGETARSDKQSYSDQGLNLVGTFVIGGGETRSIANGMTDSNVTGFATNGTIIDGQEELGSSAYYVETRQNEEGDWQFRLVDENGKAMSIRNNAADNDTLTTNWQDIPVGEAYDTGRGLTVTFGADDALYTAKYRTDGASSVDYTAQGALINVTEQDSLEDIAALINSADYAEGNEINATIVDKQLIIKTVNTGETKSLAATDVGGDTILQSLGITDASGDYKNYDIATDSSRNSLFSVNGMSVERTQNTDITDVIAGVTLDFEPDSEGLSATVKIAADSTDSFEAVDAFVKKFNELSKYIKQKISTVKNEDETYTRGGLAGDVTFRLFSSDMFATMNRKYDNDGEYRYLYELGLEFNDNNELTISDATTLKNAMKNNFDDVEKFFDELMGTLNDKIGVFTGSTGYVETAIKTTESQQTFYNSRKSSMEERLELRRTQLTNQYMAMQLEIEALTLTQQSLQAGFINMQS